MTLSLASCLKQASAQLLAEAIESAALDSRILAAHALGLGRIDLLTQGNRVLSPDELAKINALIARRAAHEPVSRIIGTREFWSLPFGLNEATLDPRPDSETLVEMALEMLCHTPQRDRIPNSIAPFPSLLDLGTGSGCLLLALLHEWPNAWGIGIDLAPRAVEQASANAERLGMRHRARFTVADWNAPNWKASLKEYRFDLIISNPPYISRNDLTELMPDVRNYDPRAALDGGEDGLDPYRLLIPQLPALLTPNGCAVFEVGQGQAQIVAAMFRQAGFSDVGTRCDLGGIERCVGGIKPL